MSSPMRRVSTVVSCRKDGKYWNYNQDGLLQCNEQIIHMKTHQVCSFSPTETASNLRKTLPFLLSSVCLRFLMHTPFNFLIISQIEISVIIALTPQTSLWIVIKQFYIAPPRGAGSRKTVPARPAAVEEMSSDAAAATLLSEQDGIFAITEESKTFSQWKRLSFGKTLVKHRGAPQRATERFRTSP